MEEIKSKLDAYLGLESQMRLFPDHYLSFHYYSPTGIPILSVYFRQVEERWIYLNSTHNFYPPEEFA